MAYSLQDRDRFADAVIRDEIRRLNTHLPKNRRTLEDLLKDPSPSVTAVSGHMIRMRKDELDEMLKSLPSEAVTRIRLPIIFLRRRDLGPGAFTIMGDPYEEYAALLLAGSFNGTFEEFKQNRRPATIYKPQVSLLLRKFHSLIVIGFATSIEG